MHLVKIKLRTVFYSEDKFFKFELVLNEEACKMHPVIRR